MNFQASSKVDQKPEPDVKWRGRKDLLEEHAADGCSCSEAARFDASEAELFVPGF